MECIIKYFLISVLCILFVGNPTILYAIIKIVYVYDGDTVKYKKNGRMYRLRLYGIDAPEIGQAYGKESRAYVHSIIENARKNAVKISIKIKGKDKYGRLVGSLYFKNTKESLGAMLIEKGLARVYKRYCKEKEICTKYLLLERKARKNALGVWSTPL